MTQSNEPTIAVINDVIGQFDEWEFLPGFASRLYKKNGITIADCDFQYHTSWDWLMPVWKKAAAIIYGIRGELTKIDYLAAHRVTKEFIDACQKVEIEKAHRAVFEAVAGITRLNQQKQKDEPST